MSRVPMSTGRAKARPRRKSRLISPPPVWKTLPISCGRRKPQNRVRLIWPHGSLHRGAQHQAALGRGEVGARMRGAAIVPQEQVAQSPDVLVDEFALLGMIEDGTEEGLAFFLRHVDD